jgi:hypothetical protein
MCIGIVSTLKSLLANLKGTYLPLSRPVLKWEGNISTDYN